MPLPPAQSKLKQGSSPIIPMLSKRNNVHSVSNIVGSATKTSKQKQKYHSPFRIKVGCIVAIRYRSEGNHISLISPSGDIIKHQSSTTTHVEVWADPQPERDEGLALVGRCVRCCFPKSALSLNGPKVSTRILEGEIVSLVDFECKWDTQRMRRQQRQSCSTKVELLVDKNALLKLPFLQQADNRALDMTNSHSGKEEKGRKLEERIRGENKVTVQVNLADIKAEKPVENHLDSGEDIVARWVIRKRVPIPLYNAVLTKIKETETEVKTETSIANKDVAEQNIDEKREPTPPSTRLDPQAKKQKTNNGISASVMRYMGDRNDSPAQQERNWRWMAGKYEELYRRKDGFSIVLVGEVLRVAPTSSTSSSSLATVTLRRLILPEHTSSGRMSHQNPYEIFDDYDCSVSVKDQEKKTQASMNDSRFWTVQIPVEEVVIISRKFHRRLGEIANAPAGYPVVTKSYSYRKDAFMALENCREEIADGSIMGQTDAECMELCHRCRCKRSISSMSACSSNLCDQSRSKSHGKKFWCEDCLLPHVENSLYNPCCKLCGCRICTNPNELTMQKALIKSVRKGKSRKQDGEGSFLENGLVNFAKATIGGVSPVDFLLPDTFLDLCALLEPSTKPITTAKKRRYTKKSLVGDSSKSVPTKTAPEKKKEKKNRSQNNLSQSSSQSGSQSKKAANTEEEKSVFKPTCSRTLAYDRDAREFSGVPKQQITSQDSELQKRATQRNDAVRGGASRHNVRLKRATPGKVERNKVSNSRAARANQRRMMKDVAAFGATSLGLDSLAGREQQLRFDKSLIHAWGVFADEPINTGDMIVEYRGILIGNTVAEKREKIYEKAKIGSDYMFRIDGDTVCDATKEGCVARFINASCNPNCYTQIVTLSGVKRIVIYAKKEIQAGEELCYDYKFPLEYDESKRIKCYCGAKGCRGFMNWDKRYIALPPGTSAENGTKGKVTGAS